MGEIFVPKASTSQYLIVCFSFNILAQVISEILWGPKFTLWGPTPPGQSLAEIFFTQSEYFTMSNSVFNYNILALVVSVILGDPKFTLRKSYAPLYAT